MAADVQLLFGVEGGGELSGESGKMISEQLTAIINAINAKPFEIKVTLNREEANKEVDEWGTQLQGKLDALSKSDKIRVQVSHLELGKGAEADFKRQINAVLNTLNLDKGTTLTLKSEGIGEIKKQVKAAGDATAEAARKAAEFNTQLAALARQGSALQTALKSLDKSSTTEEQRAEFVQLNEQYTQWAAKVEQIKILNKDSHTEAVKMLEAQQEAIAKEGEDLRKNIELLKEKEEQEKRAAAEAERAAKREESASQEQLASLKEVMNWRVRLENYLKANQKAVGTPEGDQLQAMINQLRDAERYATSTRSSLTNLSKTDLRGMNSQFWDLDRAIADAGNKGRTLGGIIEAAYKKFGGWMLVTRSLMTIINGFKDMVSNVRELDAAMTELRKVTDETEAAYDRFFTNAATRARALGATLKDTITATADFARLGYSITDASSLADTALVYKNVGDGISDINEASESVISTMKAFGIEAQNAMTIVDKFNEVGNNYAISSSGVGEALARSAAAMASANNSIDETIALATAANSVVQNPMQVGTALKTLSMYLRAAKTEAEDAGESTEGMANSVSELRDEILSLTNNKVDIQINEDTFKSSYQILKELSQVWNELSDVTQANILEQIGGKRNANIVSSILNNFDIAEQALRTSMDSAGSALAENEKYLDSINGKIAQFQAAFEGLSASVISSDLIKGFVDGGTTAVTLLTRITDLLGGLPSLITAAAAAISAYSNAKSKDGGIGLFGIIDGDVEFDPFGSKRQAFAETNRINGIFEEFNKLSEEAAEIQEGFTESIRASDETMADYLESVGAGGATLEGYTEYCEGAEVATGALGATSTAASVGVKVLVTALNTLAVLAVVEGIRLIANAIDEVVITAEEAIEQTDAYNKELQQLQETSASNMDTLESMRAEFEELSEGVSSTGENISLSAEKYDRYKDIVAQIVEIQPGLNSQHLEENGLLSDKNDLLERAIALQKEQYILEMQQMTTNERLSEALGGYIAEYNSAMEGLPDAENSLAEKMAGMFNISSDVYNFNDSNIDLAKQILNALGVEDIDATIDQYIENGILRSKDFWRDYAGVVSESIDDIATGIDFEALGFDQLGFQSAVNATRDAAAEYRKVNGELQAETQNVNTQLQNIAEANRDYHELGEEAQGIVQNFISGIDVSEITRVNPWSGLLEIDENALNDARTKINTFISELTPEVQNAIGGMFDLKELFDTGDVNVEEYRATIDAILNDLKGLGFGDDTVKYLQLQLNVDDIDQQVDYIRNTLSSIEQPVIDETSIEEEMRQLQEGGSVDLLLRPTIDAEELNRIGWEAGEGIATVLTSTFSNELGDKALNFTPIMTDENGAYIGALTPDELTEYAEAVIAGAQTDYLHLQIGAEFSGEDAIDQAVAAAERVHELQEDYYGEAQTSAEAIDEFINSLSGKDLRIAYNILAEDGSMSLDELQAKMEWLQYQGADMINVLDFSDMVSGLDEAKNGLESIISAMDRLNEGTALTKQEVANLALEYPKLLEQADLFVDGSIEGQRGLLQSILEMNEAEYNAELDTKIAELAATEQVINDQLAMEAEKANLINEIKNMSVNDQLDQEDQLVQKISELNDLQGRNFVSEKDGELTVNEEALNKQLAAGQDFGEKAATNIWEPFGNTIKKAHTEGYSKSLTATNNYATKLGTKVRNIASNIWGALSSAVNDALTGNWQGIGAYFNQAFGGGGDTMVSAGDVTVTFDGGEVYVNEQEIGDWVSEQETASKQRIEALQKYQDRVVTARKNLEALRGLSLQEKYGNAGSGYSSGSRGSGGSGSGGSGGSGASGGSGSSSSSSSRGSGASQEAKDTVKEVEEYLVDIDEYYAAVKRLEEAQERRSSLQKKLKSLTDPAEKIELSRQLIAAYSEEVDAERNLMNLKRRSIAQNADALRALGFEVEYNSEANRLFIKNLDHVNELTATSAGKYDTLQEATNALRKETEELIDATEQLNDDNIAAAGTIEDLGYRILEAKNNIIDYVEEIYKKQIEAYQEVIDKRKELLQSAKDEYSYEEQIADKVKEIADLQARIDQLSLDDSRSAQAERNSLMEQLAELQKDLADTQGDHAYDAQLEALDKMAEEYEQQKNDELEIMRDTVNDTQGVWDAFYQSILGQNVDVGASVDANVAAAWLRAAQAVREYANAVGNATGAGAAVVNSVTVPKYHDGGVVGESNLGKDEALAILQRGEVVLNDDKQQVLYRIIDFQEELAKRLGEAVANAPIRTAAPDSEAILRDVGGQNIQNNTSLVFEPHIDVAIHMDGATPEQAKAAGEDIADAALGRLYDAFERSGISSTKRGRLRP